MSKFTLNKENLKEPSSDCDLNRCSPHFNSSVMYNIYPVSLLSILYVPNCVILVHTFGNISIKCRLSVITLDLIFEQPNA